MNAPVPPPRTPPSASPSARRDDQQFLPAALAILERPASPIALAISLAICALAALALLWAWFGEIDIVAVAQGKVQPTGRVKLVQPVEGGRVIAIHVANGSVVSQGALIAELDPAEASADEANLATALAASEAEAARREAAIDAATRGDLLEQPAIAWPPSVPVSIREREMRVLRGDLLQLDAAIAALDAQRSLKQAERVRLEGSIAAQRDLITTMQERVDMRATLLERNAASRAVLLDAMESLRYQQGTMAQLTGQLGEAEAAMAVTLREMRKLREGFLAEQFGKLAEAERLADDLRNRLAKARVRLDHMSLRAPISGAVHNLSLTTVGQVVTPGEELMRIVPAEAGLEIEAYLPNKDIGFVRDGQAAVIKVESFPFTRYGTIPATVATVARDAIPEPDAQQVEANGRAAKAGFTGGGQRTQNLVFPITLQPERTRIAVEGASVPLSPGMAVTVEIRTGKRRIYDYLFSPLVEVTSTALRER